MELQQWSYSNGVTATKLQPWRSEFDLMVDFRVAICVAECCRRMRSMPPHFLSISKTGATKPHCRIHMGSVPPHFLSIGSNGRERQRQFVYCQIHMGSVPPHFLSIGSSREQESDRQFSTLSSRIYLKSIATHTVVHPQLTIGAVLQHCSTKAKDTRWLIF